MPQLRKKAQGLPCLRKPGTQHSTGLPSLHSKTASTLRVEQSLQTPWGWKSAHANMSQVLWCFVLFIACSPCGRCPPDPSQCICAAWATLSLQYSFAMHLRLLTIRLRSAPPRYASVASLQCIFAMRLRYASSQTGFGFSFRSFQHPPCHGRNVYVIAAYSKKNMSGNSMQQKVSTQDAVRPRARNSLILFRPAVDRTEKTNTSGGCT